MLDKHSYRRLRTSIRRTAKQYQKVPTQQDKTMFEGDFTYEYAYTISEVEEALDLFEDNIPSDQQTIEPGESMETQIYAMAQETVNFSSSMEARDLARTVMAYFAIEENRRNTPWPTLASITEAE